MHVRNEKRGKCSLAVSRSSADSRVTRRDEMRRNQQKKDARHLFAGPFPTLLPTLPTDCNSLARSLARSLQERLSKQMGFIRSIVHHPLPWRTNQWTSIGYCARVSM